MTTRARLLTALLVACLLVGFVSAPAQAAPTSRYAGNVLLSVTPGLIVRDAPVSGARLGILSAGAPVEGDEIATTNGREWMHITAPVLGWVAAWYLRYTDQQPPVVEPYPALPGPCYPLSDREIGLPWRWPGGKLNAYPAVVHLNVTNGRGNLQLSDAWMADLRASMTPQQWAAEWVTNQGWHNQGPVGRIQNSITFAHNWAWCEKEDSSGYIIDAYYNDETPPDLRVSYDAYRCGVMTVDYKTGHESTGGIAFEDRRLPFCIIMRSRVEIPRLPKQYTRLTYLPIYAHVKANGARLNVRTCPAVCPAVTALIDGTPITVYEFAKVNSAVWGRVTLTGLPGWVSMKYTDWRVTP